MLDTCGGSKGWRGWDGIEAVWRVSPKSACAHVDDHQLHFPENQHRRNGVSIMPIELLKTGGKRLFDDAFSKEGLEDMVAQITDQANGHLEESLRIMELKAADIDRSERLDKEIMEEKTKLSNLEEEKQNVDGRIAERVQALARVQGRLKETYKVLQVHNGPLDRSRINAADQPVVQPWPDGKNNDRTAGADSNVSGPGQEHEGGDGATEAPLEDNVPTQQGTAWREGGSPQRSGELAPSMEGMQSMDKQSIYSPAVDQGPKSTFYVVHSEGETGTRPTDDRRARDGCSQFTQSSSSTSISWENSTQMSASPILHERTSTRPPIIRSATAYRGRMDAKWPERETAKGVSLGRARPKQACTRCQRLKTKCVPNETGGGRCLRCENHNRPCSHESSTISEQGASTWQPINQSMNTPGRRVDEGSPELGTPNDASAGEARRKRACERCHQFKVKCVPNETSGRPCQRCETSKQPCSNESAQSLPQTRGISSSAWSEKSLDADPMRKAPDDHGTY